MCQETRHSPATGCSCPGKTSVMSLAVTIFACAMAEGRAGHVEIYNYFCFHTGVPELVLAVGGKGFKDLF